MAQRVLLVCDLHDEDDEETGAETILFSLDGSSYEIDLCEEHSEELREALAHYVGAARRGGSGATTTGSRRRRSRPAAAAETPRERTQDMRSWAREQGHQVSERGRVPGWIVSAYEAAH